MSDKVEMLRRKSDGCLITATKSLRKQTDLYTLVSVPPGVDCLDEDMTPVNRFEYVGKLKAAAIAAETKRQADEEAAVQASADEKQKAEAAKLAEEAKVIEAKQVPAVEVESAELEERSEEVPESEAVDTEFEEEAGIPVDDAT